MEQPSVHLGSITHYILAVFSTSKNNASKAWSSRIMSKLGYSEEEWDKSPQITVILADYSRPPHYFIARSGTILRNNKQGTKVLACRRSWTWLERLLSYTHSKREWTAHATTIAQKRGNPPTQYTRQTNTIHHTVTLTDSFLRVFDPGTTRLD